MVSQKQSARFANAGEANRGRFEKTFYFLWQDPSKIIQFTFLCLPSGNVTIVEYLNPDKNHRLHHLVHLESYTYYKAKN